MARFLVIATILCVAFVVAFAEESIGEKKAEGFVYAPDSSPLGFEPVFFDNFDDADASQQRWIQSSAPDINGKFEFNEGPGYNFTGDKGLVLPQLARRYAAAAKLPNGPINFNHLATNPIEVSYTVRFAKGLTCGGAYIKLLAYNETTGPTDLTKFDGSTPYSIMFGPDKCGSNNKIHFIIRREHPLTKQVVEHHLVNAPKVQESYLNGATHRYTLRLFEKTFSILVDGSPVKDGEYNAEAEFKPALVDAAEIDDPTDVKPPQEQWDERANIEDPNAVKPEGWDDIKAEIPDPAATKPEDWDDETDGDWEAPMIPNPDYQGEWKAPLIPNPAYKGKWTPRRIPNPNFYDFEANPGAGFLPIDALGFEIWTMNDGIVFDNVLVLQSNELAGQSSTISRRYHEPRFVEERKQIDAKAAAGAGAAYTFAEILKLAQENPILAALAGVGACLPILLICFMCTGGSSTPSKPKTEKKAPSKEKEKEKEKVEEEPAAEPTPPVAPQVSSETEGARKRKTAKKAD